MMKKQWILALVMVLCACVLSACQGGQQRFSYAAQPAATASNQATNGLTGGDESYDPRMEEDYAQELEYWQSEIATPAVVTSTPAPTIRGEFAGATPVPLDPIDKPTPTPVPPLAAFSYRTYDATKLGLSFEGPAGWLVDSSGSNDFVIQNPTSGIYPATLTVHAERVNRQYTDSDLKNIVKNMLSSIGASENLDSYSPSNTASRTLIGAAGVYANYTGVMNDGSEIAGRVHATCVEKVLYTVHITYPKAYTEQYKEQVYDKLRDTITITK